MFAVPELLAGPEDETGCFLFLPVWFFEALKDKKYLIRNLNNFKPVKQKLSITISNIDFHGSLPSHKRSRASINKHNT